ncbi:biotin--[acetyl-CoA-carboxylase] ligase [bacterium 210820-DFI.6.37]|nr:biotin--[acetyl-CoA-carboxylase] ligase [bacterium 210820-DFI.6.37]
MSVKNQVLKALEENKGTALSGEAMAEEFGVSRAAIHKAIKSLREEGYLIEAGTNKGYRLALESDLLSAQGISAHLTESLKSLPFHVYKTIDSTNNAAKNLALEGAPHGTTVLAFHQSQGKGRLGRTFISPANTGIYMSVLLTPSMDMSQSVLITTAASVAVARAIEKVCGASPSIKWVNDIYVKGKKVCGILTEAMTDFESGQIQHLILGIGINCSVEGFPQELLEVAGALEGDFSKNQLAAEVLNQLMPLMDHLEERTFIQDYRRYSMVLGKNITVYKGGYSETAQGRAARVLDIDQNGGLVVLYSSGERETLSTGEISIRI